MRNWLAARDYNTLVLGAFVRFGEHRQRRTAFKVLLASSDDPIVTTHPFDIRGDQFQAVKCPVNARSLAVIARTDVQQPMSLVERVLGRKDLEFLLQLDHFLERLTRRKPRVQMVQHFPGRFLAFDKTAHCYPLTSFRHQYQRQNAGYLGGQLKTMIVDPCQPEVAPAFALGETRRLRW